MRLSKQTFGTAVCVGVALEVVDDQTLEDVDRPTATLQAVVEREHFDEQPRSETERRRGLGRGSVAGCGVHQHLALQGGETPRRRRQPRVHCVVPTCAGQNPRRQKRGITPRARQKAPVLECPAKLIGGGGARNDHRAVVQLPDVVAIDKAANGALEVAEVLGPEQAGLTRGDHRI